MNPLNRDVVVATETSNRSRVHVAKSTMDSKHSIGVLGVVAKEVQDQGAQPNRNRYFFVLFVTLAEFETCQRETHNLSNVIPRGLSEAP